MSAPTVTQSIDAPPPDIDQHNLPPDTHGRGRRAASLTGVRSC